jgi:hypothetical protein
MTIVLSLRLPDTYIPGFHDKKAVLQMPLNPLGKTGLHVSKISFGKFEINK